MIIYFNIILTSDFTSLTLGYLTCQLPINQKKGRGSAFTVLEKEKKQKEVERY